MSIKTTKKKVEQLNLRECIVKDVEGDGGGGKTYSSGDGVVVDNEHDVINADYGAISAAMHELDDYFTLSSDVQAALEKFDPNSCVHISGEPAKEIGQLTLSGDFTIEAGAKFNLISGNYYQTDDTRYVKNFSGKNAFVQAECSEKYYGRYGIACTGSRGYCILSATKAGSPYGTGSLKLSGDLGELIVFHAISANALFSLTLDSSAESMAYQISAIDGQWVYLKTPIAMAVLPATKTEADYIELWETGEDNGFYCPSRPDVGNAVIPSMYGNHIEGAATKALQRCTHAEGRNTISDIRYSHSEGSDTVAGGMYSHAEGSGSKALGSTSHAAGTNATAKDDNSFAWSGNGTYTSHGKGTFNTNPVGGFKGFYIGEDTIYDFIAAATNAEGKMFVAADKTYYVDESLGVKRYSDLNAALNAQADFDGVVEVVDDLNSISSFTGKTDGSAFNVARKFILDLREHTLSVDAGTFMTLSSTVALEAKYKSVPDLTIRNGKIISDVSGPKFTIYNGNLRFEDVDISCDCSKDTDGTMRILRFNGSEDPNYVRKQYASIDKDCEFQMTDADYGEGMVALFTPYFRMVVTKKNMTAAEYEARYGSMDDELAPEFVVDGKCSLEFKDPSKHIIKPKHPGDFEDVIDYPNFIDTNGSDKKPSKFTFNENGYINAHNGIGFYSGSNIHCTLNGGTIIGGTGVVMRGGKLTIPANANPTVIGMGDFVAYHPYHSMVKRIDDDGVERSGSDAENFLNLGHAIVLENNGTSYGGHVIEADIKSGNLISYHNTPLGCYGLATTSASGEGIVPGVTKTLHYNGTSTVCHFFQHPEAMVEGCEMNRVPSTVAYDYATGHYADYSCVKSTSQTAVKCSIYSSLPY